MSVAVLSTVVVPVLPSVPAVQLKAPVMFCDPVPPSVPLERLSVVSAALGVLKLAVPPLIVVTPLTV